MKGQRNMYRWTGPLNGIQIQPPFSPLPLPPPLPPPPPPPPPHSRYIKRKCLYNSQETPSHRNCNTFIHVHMHMHTHTHMCAHSHTHQINQTRVCVPLTERHKTYEYNSRPRSDADALGGIGDGADTAAGWGSTGAADTAAWSVKQYRTNTHKMKNKPYRLCETPSSHLTTPSSG